MLTFDYTWTLLLFCFTLFLSHGHSDALVYGRVITPVKDGHIAAVIGLALALRDKLNRTKDENENLKQEDHRAPATKGRN